MNNINENNAQGRIRLFGRTIRPFLLLLVVAIVALAARAAARQDHGRD